MQKKKICNCALRTSSLWSVRTTSRQNLLQSIPVTPTPYPNSIAEHPRRSSALFETYSFNNLAPGHTNCPVKPKSVCTTISLIFGFVFPFLWYYATILYFRNYYQKDPRGRTGLAASTIAALIFFRCSANYDIYYSHLNFAVVSPYLLKKSLYVISGNTNGVVDSEGESLNLF